MELQAPFPYFGGKSKVAAAVWERFGDVPNYVEPFAGSLAVLLRRPWTRGGQTETVNDIDNYLVNFWRAVRADPEAVADWADWPVSETDLYARHLWLVGEGKARLEELNLRMDPYVYDVQVAGWWVWGICQWIGHGWCAGKPCRKRPHLMNAGKGINRQSITMTRRQYILKQMQRIAERIREVRICCGEWSRVLTDGVLSHGSTVGVFLDPPYSHSTARDKRCYAHDLNFTTEVLAWAIEHGDDPRLRIALCGYEGEYELPRDWTKYGWTANAAYKTHRGDLSRNRYKERIWFSPHCLRVEELLFQACAD